MNEIGVLTRAKVREHILRFLGEHAGWQTVADIAVGTGYSTGSVRDGLALLDDAAQVISRPAAFNSPKRKCTQWRLRGGRHATR